MEGMLLSYKGPSLRCGGPLLWGPSLAGCQQLSQANEVILERLWRVDYRAIGWGL